MSFFRFILFVVCIVNCMVMLVFFFIRKVLFSYCWVVFFDYFEWFFGVGYLVFDCSVSFNRSVYIVVFIGFLVLSFLNGVIVEIFFMFFSWVRLLVFLKE